MTAALPRPLLAAALAGLVALAGCGTTSDSAGDFKGPQHDVAQAVEDFQDAAQRGDEDKICNDLLARQLVQAIRTANKASRDCSSALHQSLRDVDGFDLTVQRVTISGTTATARVKNKGSGGRSEVATMSLVKEGSPPKWRIAALAG
jgi:hypothetical protein